MKILSSSAKRRVITSPRLRPIHAELHSHSLYLHVLGSEASAEVETLGVMIKAIKAVKTAGIVEKMVKGRSTETFSCSRDGNRIDRGEGAMVGARFSEAETDGSNVAGVQSQQEILWSRCNTHMRTIQSQICEGANRLGMYGEGAIASAVCVRIERAKCLPG